MTYTIKQKTSEGTITMPGYDTDHMTLTELVDCVNEWNETDEKEDDYNGEYYYLQAEDGKIYGYNRNKGEKINRDDICKWCVHEDSENGDLYGNEFYSKEEAKADAENYEYHLTNTEKKQRGYERMWVTCRRVDEDGEPIWEDSAIIEEHFYENGEWT